MGSRAMRRAVATSVAAALLAAAPAASGAAAEGPKDVRRSRLAVRYMLSRQHANGSFPGFSPVGSTADAVLTMAAARRSAAGVRAALGYLREGLDDLTSVGLKAKVVMAAVAGGRDPRSFGGHNLVAEIKASQQASGQYGDGSDFTGVASHSLAMLAVAAAGGDTVPAGAAQWLADAQCGDGGWQYDQPASAADDEHCYDGSDTDAARTDANTTSYAVQALAAAPAVMLEAKPFAYFKLARDPALSGWRYSHQRRAFGERVYTDANSTALVLQAFTATERPAPKGARRALRRLQYRLCGATGGALAFTWTKAGDHFKRVPSLRDARKEDELDGPTVIGATIGAAIGLTGEALPLAAAGELAPAPRAPACG